VPVLGLAQRLQEAQRKETVLVAEIRAETQQHRSLAQRLDPARLLGLGRVVGVIDPDVGDLHPVGLEEILFGGVVCRMV
jgi:class 3 adenylate cyclase